jgi:cysteine dioxygenase
MSKTVVIRKVPVGYVVEALCALPEDAFSDVERVRELLLANPVDPQSLAPFLCWDRQHYTRNLIEKSPVFELLALCWEVGQASSIHNHRNQNCWMAAPVGRLVVQNYHVISKDVAAHRCQLEPTDLIEMNAQRPCAVDPREPVHSVWNPKDWAERAVSLHVYSRPFDSCEVYSVEHGTFGDNQLRYTTVKGTPVAK